MAIYQNHNTKAYSGELDNFYYTTVDMLKLNFSNLLYFLSIPFQRMASSFRNLL